MFKTSSIALVSALALLAAVPAWTQVGERTAASIELQDNAPDRYTVQRGDTLWGIATKFLKEPWRWPEFWRFNQDQIRNPHVLVPGQVLVLDRLSRRLSASGGDGGLSPRVRVEPLPSDAVPSIPANVIEPWLTRPLVIEPGQLDSAPAIVASEEGRYNLGAGGRAYVKGLPGGAADQSWLIYRPGRPLLDPDNKQPLAIEAIYVGSARVLKNAQGDQPATIQVRTAQLEVTPGDRLVPEERARIITYMPRSPKSNLHARIISIYGGRGDSSVLGADFSQSRNDVVDYDSRREAGPLQIISINKGARDGLELGNVLALHRGTEIKNERSVGSYYMGGPRPESIKLPEERYGLVFVFRTFERVSYGLIVQAQRTAVPGDHARTP